MKCLFSLILVINVCLASESFTCKYDRTKGSNHRVATYNIVIDGKEMTLTESILTTKIKSKKQTLMESTTKGIFSFQETNRGSPDSMLNTKSYILHSRYSYFFEIKEDKYSLIVFRAYLPDLKEGMDVITWTDIKDTKLHTLTANRVYCTKD